jgi:hypothetical protein
MEMPSSANALAIVQAGVTKALDLIKAFRRRTDMNAVDKSILLPGTHPVCKESNIMLLNLAVMG